uniref:AbfB domain-containing protein n=1 Tax=Streptomyces sp. SS7 TaxID=3108485 RepID=UPI0040401002
MIKGLANSSCYTVTTSDGMYVHLRDSVLRAEHNGSSRLFAQDAAFCPLESPYSDAMTFQPVNHPNLLSAPQELPAPPGGGPHLPVGAGGRSRSGGRDVTRRRSSSFVPRCVTARDRSAPVRPSLA